MLTQTGRGSFVWLWFMAPFQSRTFADGQMACVDELWLGRPPVLLLPAFCLGIVVAVLNAQVVFWLMGIGLVLELGGHDGSAASKRTLFREI